MKKVPNKSGILDDQVQSSSNEHLYNNVESKQFVRVTPTPRSFSDIFSAPKMVLVKKNNVQNDPSMVSTDKSSNNVQASFVPSTTSLSTMSSTASTTLAPSTTRQTTISTTLRLLTYIYLFLRPGVMTNVNFELGFLK